MKKGDTVAILDSPEVMAKFNQAQAAEEAAQALSDKAQKGAREEQKTMAFQTWKKHKRLLTWRRSLLTGYRSCLKMMWFPRRNVMRPRPIIRRC